MKYNHNRSFKRKFAVLLFYNYKKLLLTDKDKDCSNPLPARQLIAEIQNGSHDGKEFARCRHN